jgi:hypothetical protein
MIAPHPLFLKVLNFILCEASLLEIDFVCRFTTSYISPLLVANELQLISDYPNKFDNFSMKGALCCR